MAASFVVPTQATLIFTSRFNHRLSWRFRLTLVSSVVKASCLKRALLPPQNRLPPHDNICASPHTRQRSPRPPCPTVPAPIAAGKALKPTAHSPKPPAPVPANSRKQYGCPLLHR